MQASQLSVGLRRCSAQTASKAIAAIGCHFYHVSAASLLMRMGEDRVRAED